MTDALAVRLLTKKCVGHGHADDALEALLRDMGRSSHICIADRIVQRYEEKDLVLTEPVKAGNVLKLWVVSSFYHKLTEALYLTPVARLGKNSLGPIASCRSSSDCAMRLCLAC